MMRGTEKSMLACGVIRVRKGLWSWISFVALNELDSWPFFCRTGAPSAADIEARTKAAEAVRNCLSYRALICHGLHFCIARANHYQRSRMLVMRLPGTFESSFICMVRYGVCRRNAPDLVVEVHVWADGWTSLSAVHFIARS